MLFSSIAHAMGTPPQGGAPAGGGDILVQFVPLILMFAIFWFLLIRPQQKRAKEHKKMLSELKRGDHVMTASGLIGRILELDEDQVLMECGEAKLRVNRGAIGVMLEARPLNKKEKKAVRMEKGSEKQDAPKSDDAPASSESTPESKDEKDGK